MNKEEMRQCCLTIAGSDSGGNAGIQADLRAFHAYNLHCCTVIASITAQNPFGVTGVLATPPDLVGAQLDAVLGVYNIRALKTGMLPSAAAIEVVADRLMSHPEIKKVIDPVMIATSGAKLVGEDAVEMLKKSLFPQAEILTPNIPEAEALCGGKYKPEELALKLHEKYGAAVLVKGGHGENDKADDILCDKNGMMSVFSGEKINEPISTHGTGCSLAAALACELALGRDLAQAVDGAKAFVREAIAASYFVGKNCGVLDFARSAVRRNF